MTAVFIVNYNMPERADALYEHLDKSEHPHDIYLIDNGSDLVAPAKHTNVFIKENCQTTNGWLKGMEEADKKGGYDTYMFVITSTEIKDGKDTIQLLSENFSDPEVVVVHPALTQESTTHWGHLKNRGTNAVRPTWMVDNICSMYRADWFDKQGRWDPELIYAHGIDVEMCLFARRQGKKILVDERCEVEKITDIGYTMNRMNMTAEMRRQKGWANMSEVMTKKYGSGFWNILLTEGVTEEMK
jgi:hypothetical protein